MTSFEIWRRLQKNQTVRPLPSRREGLRSWGTRLLFVLGSVLVVGSGLGAVGMVFYNTMSHSDFFQVTGIRIEGCRQTTKDMIVELSGVDIHTNLLALDAQAVEARIEEHGWVEQADIKRHWPNQLTIVIRERRPVALINRPDGLYHVDRTGAIFARVLPPDDLDFPVITGLGENEWTEAEQAEAVQSALQFIKYTGRGSPVLPQQNISELHLDKDGEITLFLVNKPFPIRLGAGELSTKYYRLAKVLNWLYKTDSFPLVTYIQLDYYTDKVLVGTRKAS